MLSVDYISQQPTSQTVISGGTAVFGVAVSGPGSFTYQWHFNGTNLPSATQSTLTLSNVASGYAGNYAVVITSASGSVTSSPAALNILYPPSIVQQPQGTIVFQGNNATFSVTPGGTAPFAYQWWMGTQSNATAVPVVINGFVLGANMTSGGAGYLSVPSVQFIGGSGTGAGGYAVVSNYMVSAIAMTNAGSGYTTPPAIQIDAPIAISLLGQTNATLTLLAVTNGIAANYFVVITNAYGSATSSVASLTVIVLPPGYNQISCQLLNDGKMGFSFVGNAGGNYALDRSFSLSPANWIPQVTNLADGSGNLIFTNAPDSTTNNFWRIRSAP